MEKTKIKESVFDGFTRKYALSKTLRFELKPVGNTPKILEDENVFEKDRIIEQKYKKTKPYFDQLHRKFIQESLKEKKIEKIDDYFSAFKKLQKNKKDKDIKKKFDNISKELRTQLNSHFNIENLFSKKIFGLLKEKYGKEEESFLKNEESGEFVLNEKGQKISIFDSWKGFTGYFTKFQETRKNLYKDDGTATAVVTRIIDQNLKRFCDNLGLFKSLKDKIDFKEVEKNFKIKTADFFILDFYNSCLLQDGIDAYNKILANGEKLKGLNEIINKYRQDNKDEKINFFKLLDKQILSEKIEFIENINDDKELLEKLKEFYSSAEEKTSILKDLFSDFVGNNEDYNLSKIYLSKEGINTILLKWMTPDGRSQFERNIFEQNKKEKIVKYNKDDKFPDFLVLAYIKKALSDGKFENTEIWRNHYYKSGDNPKGFLQENIVSWQSFLEIFSFEFGSLFYKKEKKTIDKKTVEIETGYNIYKKDFEKIISKNKSNFEMLPKDKLSVKNFVDNTLWIYQMAKYFAIEKERKWLDSEYETDSNFYEHIDWGFRNKFYNDAYDKIIKVRMLLQSYLTKKPFNTDKWKLNFENSTLADGWDKNKESANSAVVLRKDGQYYLAVMKKGHSRMFNDNNIQKSDSNNYEKMVYKTISDPVKDIPNLMVIGGKTVRKTGRKDKKTGINYILEELKNKYLPEEINKIRKSGSYLKTSDNFNRKDSQKYLTYYMQRLIEYKSDEFDFKFKKPGEYSSYSEFLKDIGNQSYKIDFVDVSEKSITKKNNEGELFLFQIYNKDWGLGPKDKKKTRTKNVHTTYFESLFSDDNKALNFPFKLNGGAELFYRPKTDEKKLGSKLDKKGKKVISHKRYSEDKVFLHVPITLNRTEESPSDYYSRKFDKEINNFLLNNPDINIIGLDRGEKHLIYYAGIDQKGNFLTDSNGEEVLGSLNKINETDYHALLEKRAGKNIKNKQDWQEIEGIKDLKKGYISLVVRKLADLIIEHNAILVFEDLNMRFKQIRGGIEKSVYQQLEKALIDKLNFLVNKGEKDPEKAGHLLHAYQLTAPFITFEKMGKQTGIIFYTQASYTSKTCPDCGFRPNIRWDGNDIKNKIKDNKVDINYKDDYFSISYNLSDFVKNQNPSKRGNILYLEKDKKTNFTVSTKDATRYKWFKRDLKETELNKGEEKMKEQTETGITIKYDITECLRGLFEKNNIDYKQNIISQLQEKESELLKKFYDKLCFYLYILTNTRSSVSGTDIDYINCPHCGFHSTKGFRSVEFNGDANGAYNIGRKGIMVLEKINQYNKQNKNIDSMNWGDLFIGIEEWDKFTQTNK